MGNSLVEAAFARLAPAIALYTIDTVQWSGPGNHPRRCGPVTDPADLRSLLAALCDPTEVSGAAAQHLVIGYLRTPAQVETVAAFLEARPALQTVILDPVIGDDGRLYVAQETAEAIAERLLPLADYIKPNLTEARWLATGEAEGEDHPDRATLIRLQQQIRSRMPRLRGLAITGIRHMSSEGREMIGVHGWSPWESTPMMVANPWFSGSYSGTGDLLTGIFAAKLLRESRPAFRSALEAAINRTHRAVGHLAREQALNLREAFQLTFADATPG